MDITDITIIIFGIITIGLGFSLLRYVHKMWKSNKNPIDNAVFFLLLSLVLIRFIGILEDFTAMFSFDLTSVLKIGTLPITDIFYMIYGIVFGWFLFYIYGLKRVYTLPFVAGFYIEFYVFLTNDPGIDTIFITFAAIVSSIILFINALKNRNGTSFSIFLATMLGILEYFLGIWWLSMIAPIVIYFVIYLGVNSWFDDNVFYDRVKRKQIQNSWISRTVVK